MAFLPRPPLTHWFFVWVVDVISAPNRPTLLFTPSLRHLTEVVLPPLVPRMTAQHVGGVVYTLACLEAADNGSDARPLTEVLVERAGELMRAQLRAGGSSMSGSGGAGGRSAGSGEEEEGQEGFVAADYAALVWGLGTLRHRPSTAWLDALCRWMKVGVGKGAGVRTSFSEVDRLWRRLMKRPYSPRVKMTGPLGM